MKNKSEKKEKKRARRAASKDVPAQSVQAEPQQQVSGAKKAANVVTKIIVAIIALIAVAVMIFTIVSVTTFDRNDRDIFGYRAYIVNTDSMSATDFNAGDLIITKQVDPATLQEGDIISYISQNSESYGETITHKILEKTEDANGAPGFITYGTTTGSTDETIVTYEYIMGKYQFRIPKAGTFFNFLRTPQGYIVCIFIPFMLLIIYQGINCIRLFRRYKNEQLAELQEEKAKIQTEREESAKMMAEMMALKAQLQQQQSGGSVTPATPVAENQPAPQPVVPTPVAPAAEPNMQNMGQNAQKTAESHMQAAKPAESVTPQVAQAPVAPATPAPQPVAPAAPAPVAPAAEPNMQNMGQNAQKTAESHMQAAKPAESVTPQVAQAPVAEKPAPQAPAAPVNPAPQPAAPAQEPAPAAKPTPSLDFESRFEDLSASMDAFFEKFLADTKMPEIKIDVEGSDNKDKTEE